MCTKAGIKKFTAFTAKIQPLAQKVGCFVATGAPEPTPATVTDDEQSDESSEADTTSTEPETADEHSPEADEDEGETPEQVDFDSHPEAAGVSVERDEPMKDDKDELYRLHVRTGHLSFAKLKAMAKRGELTSRLQNCEAPLCAACQFGKATRRPWRTKTKNRTIRQASKPGECVSVDQMESRAVGFVAQLKGRLTKGRYRVATVFVDHFSRIGFVYLQKDSSSKETLKAKHAFELYARERGVTIQRYHADNGRFVDNAWKESLAQENQSISYCGVNAHWQNGIAERRIRDLKEQTRTMLLHAIHNWPAAVEINLWPYALRTACQVFNDAPTLKGDHKDQTPRELFTGTRISAEVRHHHTFGCPVYVLAAPLQSGKSLAAWMARARVGINLGISPTHARSVALVLSLKTGLASPQFHVKHDDMFETTSRTLGGYRMPASHWQELSGFSRATMAAPREQPAPHFRARTAPATAPGREGETPPTQADTAFDGDDEESLGEEDEPPDGGRDPQDMPGTDAGPPASPNDESERGATGATRATGVSTGAPTGASTRRRRPNAAPATHTGATTRSGRKVRVTQRARESRIQESNKWVAWIANALKPPELSPEDEIYEVLGAAEYDIQDRAADPIAFSATSDPDTMYWHQAMQQPDKKQFLQAAVDEVKSHVENEHFVLVPRTSIPKGTRVLASVWSMKRKRRILSREVYKWKARLNAHGGQQEHGVNFWETYAPVVNWFSIRLYLVISILKGWETRQIDFVLAFPQADVECDIYMEVPMGFDLKGDKKKYCLKLKKNIYGTKQGGRVWNRHLHKGLLKLGYKPSLIDSCVYYKGRTVFMLYVDDGIFCGPDKAEIDDCIAELKGEFNITDEGNLNEYLGVLVDKQEDGRIKLSQPHLIKQILDDLWFNKRTKSKPTPAPGGQVLERELDAEAMNDDFHYRSVIGKANFLEKSTRPDIAVAVHQCARFSADPKKSHADAARYFGKYLAGTKDKGIMLDPDNDKSFECWVDADFLGQYVKGAGDMHLDAMTAKSRTGYIITYAGCPITWASKLQSEAALSSTESEYLAISEAFRTLLPLMDLLEEARAMGVPIKLGAPVVHCKAFEDNSGALELARLPKMRPRTRHINVKYHHFREAVAKGRVTLQHVASKDQLGDALTKNLARDLFVSLRKRYMGW
jgi:transposase InsO family protein